MRTVTEREGVLEGEAIKELRGQVPDVDSAQVHGRTGAGVQARELGARVVVKLGSGPDRDR